MIRRVALALRMREYTPTEAVIASVDESWQATIHFAAPLEDVQIVTDFTTVPPLPGPPAPAPLNPQPLTQVGAVDYKTFCDKLDECAQLGGGFIYGFSLWETLPCLLRCARVAGARLPSHPHCWYLDVEPPIRLARPLLNDACSNRFFRSLQMYGVSCNMSDSGSIGVALAQLVYVTQTMGHVPGRAELLEMQERFNRQLFEPIQCTLPD